MRFWLPRAVLASLAVLILIELAVIAPRWEAGLLVLSLLWMAVPGVILARAVLGVSHAARIGAYLIGPALGFGLSVFGMFGLWAVGLQNWLTVVWGPWLPLTLTWLTRRYGAPTLRVPAFDRRDLAMVTVAMLVVPIVTWAPYDHVRQPVAEGEAYRAYFTADFIWAMDVTAELAKGEVPPVNTYLPGDTLHYYWMAHFLSGVLYHNVQSLGVFVEQVILFDGIAFGLAFAAFMYALARWVGASPGFAALFVLIGFLANSYEGANRIWVLWQRGGDFNALRDYNIDAVTRWFYNGMPVDGLQRLLLYQPHHLTGYVMGLSALWLVGFAEDVTETSVALWAGVLLGLGFLFSTFSAIMFSLAVGIVYAIKLFERRAFGAIVPCAILGGGPAVVGAVLTSILGYTDANAGVMIEVGLNPVATRRWPLMLFLSFGPLLFLGLAGLGRVKWVRREGLAVTALVFIALAFYFFTNVPDMEGVWVGWRAGHQLLIGFSLIGAALLTIVWQRRAWRVPLAIVLLLALVPAVPTVAIDVYNAQDITNRNPGPNFPWTLIITPQEREALDWLKRATPPDARVQFEAMVRGNTHWSYLQSFGERRAAAGLPGAMIPFKKFQEASENIQYGIFMSTSAQHAHDVAKSVKVDYLWIGEPERRAYPQAVAEIVGRPDLFVPVFRNDAVAIFAVR